jgi:hypothetical protein
MIRRATPTQRNRSRSRLVTLKNLSRTRPLNRSESLSRCLDPLPVQAINLRADEASARAERIANSFVEVVPPSVDDGVSRAKWTRAFSIAMDTLANRSAVPRVNSWSRLLAPTGSFGLKCFTRSSC